MNVRNFKLLALTFAIAFTVAACGASANSNDPNSPTAITKRFVAATQSKDVAAFKSVISKKSLATIEKDSKEAGMTSDQMIARVLGQNLYPKGTGELETRNEAISGDTATVEFKDGSGKWQQNELVREDGNWRVNLD